MYVWGPSSAPAVGVLEIRHALLWCWPLEGCQGNHLPAPEMQQEERRVGDSGCLLRHGTHYMEKGLRDILPPDTTEVILLILPSSGRAVSPSPTSDWWELARFPREGNGLRHPWPH